MCFPYITKYVPRDPLEKNLGSSVLNGVSSFH